MTILLWNTASPENSKNWNRIKICKFIFTLFLMQQNFRKQYDFSSLDWDQRNYEKSQNNFSENFGKLVIYSMFYV